MVLVLQPGLQPRRQIPLLRLEPELQPDVRPDGMEPHLRGHGAHLPRDAGEGHRLSVRARKRRGERSSRGERGKEGQGQKREGRDEGAETGHGRQRRDPGAHRRHSGDALGLRRPRLRRRQALLHETRQEGLEDAARPVRARQAEGNRARRGRRVRNLRGREEDARRPRGILLHHRPSDRQDRPERTAERRGYARHSGPSCGVESDLRRMLAPDARLLLRSVASPRRLAAHAATLRGRSSPS